MKKGCSCDLVAATPKSTTCACCDGAGGHYYDKDGDEERWIVCNCTIPNPGRQTQNQDGFYDLNKGDSSTSDKVIEVYIVTTPPYQGLMPGDVVHIFLERREVLRVKVVSDD